MKRKLFTKVLATMMLLLGISGSGLAQFKIGEDFTKSTTTENNVVFLKNGKGVVTSYLTAAKGIDADGDGWLRLTEDKLQQSGGVIFDERFPSDKGVVLDFEYKTWRNLVGDSQVPEGFAPRGGDGFTVFLIDGSVEGKDVVVGGDGHHLGYGGQLNDPYEDTKPVTGAYLGLGLDEYGNYIFEGTNGYYALNGLQNNNWIEGYDKEVMRYKFVNSVGLRGSANYKGQITPLIAYKTLKENEGGVGFSKLTSVRPNDRSFYRRVQMELYKYKSGYKVEVRWKRDNKSTTPFEELFTAEYDEVPSEFLKIGFSAGTGSAVNNHEIRGLSVFMPEGVKVEKFVDKESTIVGENLTYRIEVRNLSQGQYKGVVLNDLLGAISDSFEVKEMSFKSETGSTFTNAGGFDKNLKQLENIKVDLDSRDAAVFTIKGTIVRMPVGGVIKNTATINVGALKFYNEKEAIGIGRLESTVETQVSFVGDDFCENEGDNFISGYHSTIIKTAHGFEIFGERSMPTGGQGDDFYVPTLICPEKGFDFKGSPLHATLGARDYDNSQNFLLTTDGLYVWGSNGYQQGGGSHYSVVSPALVNTSKFQKMTLPTGVTPKMVRYMTASHRVLALLLTDGRIMINGTKSELYGDGTSEIDGNWHTVSKSGNTPLLEVEKMKVHTSGGFAYTKDGKYYAWGSVVYNGSYRNSNYGYSYAEEVSSPFKGEPEMIAITGHGEDSLVSYFTLAKDGKVYSMGSNSNGELGVGDLNERVNWETVKTEDGEDLKDIKYLNAQDHASYQTAAGAINKYGRAYFWGNNAYNMLGQDQDVKYNIPSATEPQGLDNNRVVYLEVGGHTGMIVNDNNKYCYVGHKVNGSMGDGREEEDRNFTVHTFDCENTANVVEMCGKIEIEPEPGLLIHKVGTYVDSNKDGKVNVGDHINYTFTVSNTGNTILKDISLTDGKIKLTGGPIETLNPNGIDNGTFSGVYEITQVDIDRGGVFNIALGTAKDPNDKPIVSKSIDPEPLHPTDPNYPLEDPKYKDCATCTVTTLPQDPSITLVKVGVFDEDTPGDNGNGIINYTFTMTNTGNVTLNTVELIDFDIDPFKPVFKEEQGTGSLEVGKSWTATFKYSVTDADMDLGYKFNQALVMAKSPRDKEVEAESGTEIGNENPTITEVEGGGPLMTNPHIYHKVQ
ncbi:DUF11 domain-containing protein [Myroides phaeus]|uniref:DUF7507 domain-containing protein n=1 Tax=Myroides phaeus TaxID=702745 RepID=UPI001303B52A|nr:DUF11 domain-containing protein [Myroides phaeus]